MIHVQDKNNICSRFTEKNVNNEIKDETIPFEQIIYAKELIASKNLLFMYVSIDILDISMHL